MYNNHLRRIFISALLEFLADLTIPRTAPVSVPIGPVTKIPKRGPRLFEGEKISGPIKPTMNARPPTIAAIRMIR
jgi:hypothetical protein